MVYTSTHILRVRNPYTDLAGPQGMQTLLSVCTVSTLFYGIYLVLAVISVYLHSIRRAHEAEFNPGRAVRMLRNPVLLGTIALFVVITVHWILTVVAVYSAVAQTVILPALQFYADPLPPVALARNLFLRASWMVGDLLIVRFRPRCPRAGRSSDLANIISVDSTDPEVQVHRLWTVWHHSWLVVAFPILTWLGLTASGIGTNVVSSLHFLEPNKIFPLVHGWFMSELVFTLCTTLYCTVMLAFRIWRKNSELRELGGRSGTLMTVLANIVESAVIHTIWIVLNFVAYQIRSPINFWVFESSAAVVGIVNMLIYVRVGLGWTVTSHIGRLPTTRFLSSVDGQGTGTHSDGSEIMVQLVREEAKGSLQPV
ncbi:hypothetical protein DFH09DRAFT_129074 [Mycena vulgaris]|nr:hypothetical protein DFH09DRAFT_129074 [Mycena vulgaris]